MDLYKASLDSSIVGVILLWNVTYFFFRQIIKNIILNKTKLESEEGMKYHCTNCKELFWTGNNPHDGMKLFNSGFRVPDEDEHGIYGEYPFCPECAKKILNLNYRESRRAKIDFQRWWNRGIGKLNRIKHEECRCMMLDEKNKIYLEG